MDIEAIGPALNVAGSLAGSVVVWKLLGDLLKQTIPREVNRLIAAQEDASKLSEQRHAETLRAVLSLQQHAICKEIKNREKKSIQDASPGHPDKPRRTNTRPKKPAPRK